MNSKFAGYLLVVGSAATFAATSFATQVSYRFGLNAWSFSFVHSILALLPLALVLGREHGRSQPAPRPSRRWLLLFAASGATAAIGFNLALARLSLSLSTILLFSFPAFVALEAWAILGHRPSGNHLLALVMTLAGVVLTANPAEAAAGLFSPAGAALAVMAGASHGLYMTSGERLGETVSPGAATLLTRLVIIAGVALLHPSVFLELAGIPWEGWLIGAASAAVAGVAPFFLLYKGIALIGANRAAIVSTAELPIALGLGLLFQGDLILPLQWIGAALIGGAMVISQLRET